MRTLGVADGMAILIGITIGAGIFSTPNLIAAYFSSFTVIGALWLAAGLFVFVGGLIYAELGTRLPNTGGEYVYITRTFGRYAGFLFGWSQLLIIRTSPAAGLAIITANYLGYFFEMSPAVKTGVALGTIALLGALNYRGVRWSAIFQKLSTAIKIGGLFLFVVLGLFLLDSWGGERLTTTQPPTSGQGPLAGFSAVMILIVFSYLGWDRLGYVAGEMKNPRRVVPISLVLGIALVTATYFLTNLIYHQTLGIEGVRDSLIVASDTAEVLMGAVGAAFVSVLAMISTTGSINGTMLTSSRVYYAMAHDGLFFRWLDYVHPRFRTPSRAVLAHCLWAAVILLVRQNFEDIVGGMVFAILIFFSLTTVALFKLRREGTGGEDCYRMPLYPFLPVLYLAGILTLIGFRFIFDFWQCLQDLAFIASGIPFAIYWCRRGTEGGRRQESCLGP